jgi:hypothetical protein
MACAAWSHWLRRLSLAAAYLSVARVILACVGCHTAALEDGVYRKGELRVRLGAVPSDWSAIQVDGADVAYRDAPHEGSVLFDVRCHDRDGDAPLASLTEHLIMGTTERDVGKQETIPFDGREAMHTVMSAKLDGVPLQYDLYVMKKDGCVYDVVYVAPAARFAGGAPTFEAFAAGLHASSGP